jgi:hypothetical protein
MRTVGGRPPSSQSFIIPLSQRYVWRSTWHYVSTNRLTVTRIPCEIIRTRTKMAGSDDRRYLILLALYQTCLMHHKPEYR